MDAAISPDSQPETVPEAPPKLNKKGTKAGMSAGSKASLMVGNEGVKEAKGKNERIAQLEAEVALLRERPVPSPPAPLPPAVPVECPPGVPEQLALMRHATSHPEGQGEPLALGEMRRWLKEDVRGFMIAKSRLEEKVLDRGKEAEGSDEGSARCVELCERLLKQWAAES